MCGGKHPKLAQLRTEFPTLIEPSVSHLRACASAPVDTLRASKALGHCLDNSPTFPGGCPCEGTATMQGEFVRKESTAAV